MWLLDGIGFVIDGCAVIMVAAQLGGKPVDSSFYEAAVAELRRRWGELELLVVRYRLRQKRFDSDIPRHLEKLRLKPLC